MRQHAAGHHVGAARQERGWPPSGLGHHGRPTRAQCPRGREGTAGARARSGASCGQPRMRTHGESRVNTSFWAFVGPDARRRSAAPCRWKKGLSLQPTGVPRGRPWGEPCSIPRGPPGQGRDPQVSRTETLESNFALECMGWRRGVPSHRRGCVRASSESRGASSATIAWRRQPTALRAGRRGRDHPEPPCCGSVAYQTRLARFTACPSEASRLVKQPSGEQWLDPSTTSRSGPCACPTGAALVGAVARPVGFFLRQGHPPRFLGGNTWKA